MLTTTATEGIGLLVVRVTDQICGSVGTGRRARLRILCALRSCGFKSHLPHENLLSKDKRFFYFWVFRIWSVFI